MHRRSTVCRVIAAVAISMVGLAPALAVAPAAQAAPSALTATSPPAFAAIPVGQVAEQDVQVTNTGGTALTIDLATSSNSGGSFDFFPGPAVIPNPTSCLTLDANGNLIPASIPGGAMCTLGVYFLPTHFGPRATTMTIEDNVAGTFSLSLSGTGGAGYYLAGAASEWAATGLFVNLPDPSPLVANPNKPVVGISGTSGGDGFWLDATDGGVFTAGSAGFFGSTGNLHLNKPVVGIAGTPSDSGYWLVASDGGIFTFGDAGFFGSTGSLRLNKPVVGMAATPSGNGYWLVASDGGIFTFGDAGFFGSTGNLHLNKPVVGMAASPTGRGYWMVASDGGIFTFGDAPFEGSLPGAGIPADDVIGMAPTTAPLFGPFLTAPASFGSRTMSTASILAKLKSGAIHLQRPAAAAKHH